MKNINRYGAEVIRLAFVLILFTVLLLWGWNSAIPDLFGFPAMRFKQSMGIMILLGIFFFLLHGRGGYSWTRGTRHLHGDPLVEKQS
jgi:hypothetical protein